MDGRRGRQPPPNDAAARQRARARARRALGRAVHRLSRDLLRGQGHALAGGIDQLALRHGRPLQHQGRGMEWVGYKVHFTETCDADWPRLIVNVETTPATTPDDNMIEYIHESEKVSTLGVSTWSTRATPIPWSWRPA